VDPWQEVFRRKAGRYAILGCGVKIPLCVKELRGHLHETIAMKGEWISASTMMHGIIFTPQVTLGPQIWDQICRWNGIRVHQYSLETQYQ
jgi:hypothetical protein